MLARAGDYQDFSATTATYTVGKLSDMAIDYVIPGPVPNMTNATDGMFRTGKESIKTYTTNQVKNTVSSQLNHDNDK
jgi:hypothetical protein